MPTSDWDMHYKSDVPPPWESGNPSSELARIIAEQKIKPCRVVELGCGSGINAVWLAQQGFDVTGIDVSGLAIERAKERVAEAGVKNVRLIHADLVALPNDLGTFPFFFDRGCYHAVRRHDVAGYMRTLEQLTVPGSIGLVLTGNAKDNRGPNQGPPVVSDSELHAEFEPAFQIVQLREFRFDDTGGYEPFLAWSCFLRRR